MAADWSWARRAWEKWAAKHVGPSGKPVQAALLLNYDPSGPSRLLPVVAEQERTQLSALDMHPFLDFVKRGNLQTEFFSVGPNQCMMVLLLQLHKQWWLLISLRFSLTGGVTNFQYNFMSDVDPQFVIIWDHSAKMQ
ncbi:uncharacterized protein [Miscanthus floridulus]|uniref:uncharacterized protein isoform X2 n=1 Tax=Miscanthus floridulus TaxID=154761 RepID=UPI0034590186